MKFKRFKIPLQANACKMKTIKQIFSAGRSTDNIINDLREKSVCIQDDWSVLVQAYEPKLHGIVTDTSNRKDKIHGNGKVDKAARIYVGLEKLLVNRMTEFMCAIPVKRIYHNIDGNETRQEIAKAIESIYKYARINAENLKRIRAYFASCEVFTIWYTVKQDNSLYGFNSKYKLKCKTYSPMDGVKLYPYMDSLGDMLAMSFEYTVKNGNEMETYFETYTADRHYKWKQNGGGWETEIDGEEIVINKIPGVYVWRQAPVYDGLTVIREEIEYTLSRNSDTIAYNAAPVLKVVGALQGEEHKGSAQRIFRVENGGDVAYVAWQQAIEAVKYHVDTLLKMYWMQSQMPDVSFDNMAHLGNIGFDARQTLLTDAHLKVGDEKGALEEAFEREANVIKAFIKEMNTSWASEVDNIEIEHIITPFIQNDERSEIDKWMSAAGGKPIMSQLEAITNSGLSNDPAETLKQINAEAATETAARMSSIMEQAM